MKPFWPPTLQLLPVHLQARDAYIEGLLGLRMDRVASQAYGVVDMKPDDAAWQRGVLTFQSISVVFPSGLFFKSKDPVSRDGATLPRGASSVFLGVPKTVLRGPNVGYPGGVVESARFEIQGTPEQPWLLPHARLLSKTELTEDFEVVRLGRIERSGTRLQWQAGSIPTVARVRTSATLQLGLDRLVAAMTQRKSELLRFRTDHPFRMTDAQRAELPGLQLLVLIQRYLPTLRDLAASSSVPPRDLYAALVELHAALGAFAAEERLAPPYVHESLADSIPWLFKEIGTLLDEAARDRTTVLPFVRGDASTFRLTFQREALVGKRPFLVASGAEEIFLRDRVPSLLKMASPTAMPSLIHSALRGVAIAVEFEPAPSIPRRPDIVTYRIDVRDPLWLDIEDRRSIVLHVPNAPSTLNILLYAIERTL
jgi:type VI secretion system ImpJ/VasE family protein